MKIGTHVSCDAADAELRYLSQLGVQHVRVHVPEVAGDATVRLQLIKKRFATYGLDILSAVYLPYQSREIAFGLPGRDAILAGIAAFLEAMGRVEIAMLDYDFFLYAPLPGTGMATTRSVPTREFRLDVAAGMPALIEQSYSDDEMWENHRYMMEILIPAAERAGVRLALHETFLDNGYVNMADIMQVLVECDFDGLAIPDHFPSFDGDAGGHESLAFAIGYMRGLRDLATGIGNGRKGSI